MLMNLLRVVAKQSAAVFRPHSQRCNQNSPSHSSTRWFVKLGECSASDDVLLSGIQYPPERFLFRELLFRSLRFNPFWSSTDTMHCVSDCSTLRFDRRDCSPVLGKVSVRNRGKEGIWTNMGRISGFNNAVVSVGSFCVYRETFSVVRDIFEELKSHLHSNRLRCYSRVAHSIRVYYARFLP